MKMRNPLQRLFFGSVNALIICFAIIQVSHGASQSCSLDLLSYAPNDPKNLILDCLSHFKLPSGDGGMHYYSSSLAHTDTSTAQPKHAIIAIHGAGHDAARTFYATFTATKNANHLNDTLVIAPLFQTKVDDECHKNDNYAKASGKDFMWSCHNWISGKKSLPNLADGSGSSRLSSFAALASLVKEVKRKWPSLEVITVAGFSAGAQFVQHYIGFAPNGPQGVKIRYVVSDPGSWLYFDSYRPHPPAKECIDSFNTWKYGLDGREAKTLFDEFKRSASEVRQHYAKADISYLEGELDNDDNPKNYFGASDKNCQANAQGSFRKQRGLHYATYDQTRLSMNKSRTVKIIPGCYHDVLCVFTNPEAQEALGLDKK